MTLTNAQINFFEVEIRNEREGGVSPSTLGSACESLEQAPEDVIIDWCDDDTVTDGEQVNEFITSVQGLVSLHGEDCLLIELLP
jgi:hypothetical protein